MTSDTLSTYLGRIRETDDVRTLSALAAEIRRAHPLDSEADVVARQAELKGRRIRQEN